MSGKILISQGQGRLHFSEVCESLENENVNFNTLIGWSPKYVPNRFVDIIGLFFNKSNLSKRLKLRVPENVESSKVISCSLPEFYYYGLILLAKIKFVSIDFAFAKGWAYWGSYSKRYLEGKSVLHVRSGAGQGGCIDEAQKKGVKVIADHSIAHPMIMEDILLSEYKKFNLSFDLNPRNQFWQMVLKDCSEANYLLVNSQFVADTFIEQKYNKEKIKVIYLGVREDFFNLKRNWDIHQPVRLLFTGSFSVRKGAHVIIEALSILKEANVDVVLDVVGYFDELKAIEKHYKMPSNIFFHGNILQDELKDFLINSDIYIFPTLAEGSARSAMEAMAAGLPVITTENCGSPIEDGKTGLIVPIKDAFALANAIRRLIENNELRKEIGMSAASEISQNYKWSDYAKNLNQWYREIVEISIK